MQTLSDTAAAEWAHAAVRVNCVAPGVIASSGFDTYPEEQFKYIRGLAKRMPMGRFGNEAEISSGIVFLLTDAASYISGSTMRIDGAAPNARQTLEISEPRNQQPFGGFHRAKPIRT
jgi:citronellol/citronellal dehydrogenase